MKQNEKRRQPVGVHVTRRKKQGAAARRRRTRPRSLFMRAPLYRLLAAVVLFVALAAIGQVASGFLRDQPYFKVSQLQIEGLSKPIAGEVQSMVKTFLDRNNNIISLDSGRLVRALEKLPRVRNLKLEKVMPDTLLVRASERTPSAIVIADGFFLVDREGFVMERLAPARLRDYNIPYINGLVSGEAQAGDKVCNPNLYRALDLIFMLQENHPDLFTRLSEVNIDRDKNSHMDNFRAVLKGGLEVRFGDGNPIEKLPALEMFVNQMKEKGFDPYTMTYVDLRFKNQIAWMDRFTAIAQATGLLDKLRQQDAAETAKGQKDQGGKSRAAAGSGGKDNLARKSARDAAAAATAGKQASGQNAAETPVMETGGFDDTQTANTPATDATAQQASVQPQGQDQTPGQQDGGAIHARPANAAAVDRQR
ncbi:MAG: cell division protein FtsQ/DivIB [bacterium]|nr:cell division protein FtsQ/DivIB [Candidatus Sumerlaeota bacterium]